jgi:hypothetical protein
MVPPLDVNQNRHTEQLIEYTGLLFRKVDYSINDVPSKMFCADNITVPLQAGI